MANSFMNRERRPAVVVLAAGMGTRMKSDLPKVLHPLNGAPMIEYVLNAAEELQPYKTVVIVGHRRELVHNALKQRHVECVVQEPQLGTGHAVLQAERVLRGFTGNILVLSGDVPLIRAQTLSRLVEFHESSGVAATVLSTTATNPSSYGRVVRDERGIFVRIVEERDATESEREIREINSGIYCFKSGSLFTALRKVSPCNAKGEFYLTDVIGILKASGENVQAVDLAEFWEVRGINTPEELKEAESVSVRFIPSE